MRLEVETALGDPDVTVTPLLVGGGRMPHADELPESVRPLSRRNALELSDLRWRHDVGRLVGTLGEPLDGRTKVAAGAAQPVATRRVRRTWMGAVAAVLALGVAAAVLALARLRLAARASSP